MANQKRRKTHFKFLKRRWLDEREIVDEDLNESDCRGTSVYSKRYKYKKGEGDQRRDNRIQLGR